MQRALIAIALTAGLLLPATAEARTSYQGERPASARVMRIVRAANAYWDRKGVAGCRVTVLQAPRLLEGSKDAWGRGDGASCTMWVADALDVSLLAAGAAFDAGLAACGAIFHELGHARGLHHSLSGVMAGEGSPEPRRMYDNSPWWCVKWELRQWRRQLKVDGSPTAGAQMLDLWHFVRRNRTPLS